MISSRPNSPFKWASRPPSRSSPSRSSPSRTARSDRFPSEEQSPRPSYSTGHSSNVVAGPSRYGAKVNSTPTYSTNHSISRAEHYDVVIESEAAADILPHLGPLVQDQSGSTDDVAASISLDFGMPRSGSASSINAISNQTDENIGENVSSNRFESLLEELVHTERSYVKRIDTLYQRYAVPLRQLAKDRDTAIIPVYEAQRLFGNLGEVLGANMAFLKDLERFLEIRSRSSTSDLGDIVYRNVSCFSCYNEYFSNFEKAKSIEQAMSKNNRAFREFVERTKSNTTGIGNVGLRELIMEPVQRIPRYTLLLDGLVRNISPSDPTRARLEEAIALASKIASCEVDDKTKRAAVHWSFTRNIDGFPSGLISVHRQLIDCIDVDDFPIDVAGPSAMNGLLSPASTISSSSSYRTIHCSLFLFDDVIAITKRAGPSSCGRTLLGLDDLNRLADQMKSYTERNTNSHHYRTTPRVELSFRGLIDLADVKATDIAGPDLQLTMANPPSHVVGEKWSSRLVRQYATVDVNSMNGSSPAQARSEKQRFLENVWRAQALLKTREYRSEVRNCVVPSSCDPDRVRRVIYWNIFYRREYLMEASKTLAVLHVDPDIKADNLPFGPENTAPAAIMRVHDFDKESGQCDYSLSLREEGKEGPERDTEVYTLQMNEIATQLFKGAKTALQVMADFAPRQSISPSTPASSHRGRSLATGLEQFGRSLFGTPTSMRSHNTGSDLFGVKRSRSKGSSGYQSRNPSTSTRMTYSTADTSSIGSRDMLAMSTRLDVPGNDGVKLSVAKYRQVGVRDDENGADDVTPTKAHLERQPTVSPSPRKGDMKAEDLCLSPRRITSTSSKRYLDHSSYEDGHDTKRIASMRLNRAVENVKEEAQLTPRAESPSLTPSRKPTGPREAFSRKASIVAPLRLRKDAGQLKHLSREDRIQSLWKDIEMLKSGLEGERNVMQMMQIRLGSPLEEIEDREAMQNRTSEILHRLQINLQTILADSKAEVKVSPAVVVTKADPKELQKLQGQISALTRKCELLTALEKDGRMENTELHKAFNEELDRMYEDASLSQVEQIKKLREEVKNAKLQRNEANIENKSLQRELALEKAQGEVYKALLEANGLL